MHEMQNMHEKMGEMINEIEGNAKLKKSMQKMHKEITNMRKKMKKEHRKIDQE
jgi:uncharacterized coiled-coil DUF342 family protein